MKLWQIGLGVIPALLISSTLANHSDIDEYALEPSINGGVSASGLFASQEEEDRYLADEAALEFEPCINGDVSSSGRFASQAEEDLWLKQVAGS